MSALSNAIALILKSAEMPSPPSRDSGEMTDQAETAPEGASAAGASPPERSERRRLTGGGAKRNLRTRRNIYLSKAPQGRPHVKHPGSPLSALIAWPHGGNEFNKTVSHIRNQRRLPATISFGDGTEKYFLSRPSLRKHVAFMQAWMD